MAQEQENAKTAEAGAVLAEPSAATEGEALAEGIEALQAQALDGSEVSKQLEDLRCPPVQPRWRPTSARKCAM